MATLTLLDDGCETTLEVRLDGGALRVSPDDVARVLGWSLEPEGLCRGGACVPVRDRTSLVVDGAVDLAALARLLDRPLVVDAGEGVAALGASAAERGARLRSLVAPEVTLPDLDGRTHPLAEFRGRKALLLAWAGW